MAGEKPYQTATGTDWVSAVEALLEQALTESPLREGVNWMTQFDCPRCKHVMTVTVPWGVRPLVEEPGISVPVICNCDVKHPNTPDDRSGCGHGWNYRLPLQSSEELQVLGEVQ